MPAELKGSENPLARNCVTKTIEAATAGALDTAVASYLSSLKDMQRLLHYDVWVKPDGSYFAILLTAG